MSDAVIPFELAIEDSVLDDLATRLAHIRWPEREPVADGSQGLQLAHAQALCAYWRDHYDWRRCERMLNGFGQFHTRIDELDIHFLHARSPEPDALPLILTHGWPGSVIEFHKLIGPLTDPRKYGGDPRDAFHVVAPSLPGYGFSERPSVTGWSTARTAEAWIALMQRLGYDRYVAQGGDWGAAVTNLMAARNPPGLAAIHLNVVAVHPTEEERQSLTAAEQAMLDEFAAFIVQGAGYAAIQSTLPQTIGYALTDSAAGQAAWIYEKFIDHADCRGDPLSVFTHDELIDNIMLYWLSATGASAARLYWESYQSYIDDAVITVPTGCSIFPREVFRASRHWAERKYPNIIHWNVLDRGGHFPALEQPDLLIGEIRACFRSIRTANEGNAR